MVISGVPDDRAAAVIDATGFTRASFVMPFGRTGIVRTGHGSNAVEWLTILGHPDAAAAIETDMSSTAEARVRVAHVVAGNSARGVDVRNVGAAMIGRRLRAEIVDNDFFRGETGIRVSNFVGAHLGDIEVTMSGNRSFENSLGCLIANNRSNRATIAVTSRGDSFEDNQLGCWIVGGISSSDSASFNTTRVDCYGTRFINNRRTTLFNNTGPVFTDSGGVVAVAGERSGLSAITSSNTLAMRMWGCEVSGNQHADFEAYGARSTVSGELRWIDNHTIIELYGTSKRVDVLGGDSSPFDLFRRNTLTIIR
jgi:hypothetical protein